MQPFEFLGPYRIGEPLGRGGMGTVYSAVHEKTGEAVAVKLIASNVADEPRFRRRFDAEVKTLQRLRHDGIVRLIGFGEESGQLFYSMELVVGEPLQKRIRREKKIGWRETIDTAVQVCSALKHAHDIGVIHRDLKPANLILTEENQVKLVDFGIAKIFGDGEQTVAGSVLGTADYMAPEQATSSGITQRTDLYALGSLMYAMLAGRPPFTGKKITEVIESLKRDRPVPLDLIDPELPDALVELINELLHKEPADRPPTALAVMNRLKAMRAGLDREQTVVGDRSSTVVGSTGENAFDTSSVSDDPHESTSVSEDPTQDKRKRTVVSKGGTVQPRSLPSDATVVSHGTEKTVLPDGSVPEDEQPDSTHAKTHFQTVSDTSPTSGLFKEESSDTTSTWKHWLAIAGMISVLVVGAALLVNSMRPPSADELYQGAIGGDAGAMRTFIRRFPDDHRYPEIFNRHMENRLTGVLKRLKTQAKLGVTPLDASEEGFVGALEGREQEPERSMQKLEQWLNVYGNDDAEEDEELKELVELARHEQASLAVRAPEIIVDARAQDLIDDIRETVTGTDSEAIRRKLVGIIETFRGDAWARPAVDEAKRQLDSLDEFAPDATLDRD